MPARRSEGTVKRQNATARRPGSPGASRPCPPKRNAMSARSPRLIVINSAYLGLSFAAKILLYALLARQLARPDLGVLLYGVALLELALGISSFGVPQLAVREMSTSETDVSAFFANLLALRMLFAGLALAAVAAAMWAGVLLPAHAAPQVILIVVVAVLPKTLSECLDVLFAVREKFLYPATVETLSNALFVIGCLALVFYDFELSTLAWLYVAVACVAASARALLLRGALALRARDLTVRACRRILRQLAPFGLLGLTLVIYLRVGDVLIVRLSPDGVDELATFKMAHMPVVFLIGLLSAAVMPFYGNVTRLRPSAGGAAAAELARRLQLTVRGVLVVGGLLVLGPLVFAEAVLITVCGVAWASSAPLLQLLLCHAPLPAITAIIGRALQAMGRERPLAIAGLLVLILKIIALWLVLPRFGAAGLAAVTVGAAAIYSIVVAALGRSLLDERGGWRIGLTAAIVAAALGLAYRGVTGSAVLNAALGYALLLGTLLLTRCVTLAELGQLIGRRPSAATTGRG